MSGPSVQSVACKECRQQKVRCTGRSEDGSPCDRCTKRGLDCVIDFHYKRTIKRKAIESLEAEIAELRQRLGTEEAEDSPNSAITVVETAGKNAWTPNKRTKPTQLPPAGFSAPHSAVVAPLPSVPQVDSWFCTPKSTESVSHAPLTLGSDTIEMLFREYVTHYHRVLPVVEVHRGPEFVYSASAALFWTMMAIGSRRHGADLPEGTSFELLCKVQESHLAQMAVSPILGNGKSSEFNLPSLYAVQAFLLCTLWPPPTASINADMSWNTAGIAVLTAMRAGLHCPGHAADFERIFRSNNAHCTNLREQLVTWLATNALSQAIANMFGYPSQAKFCAHRQFLFHNVDLPPRVRHMYEIQRVAYEIEQSLGQLGQGGSSIDVTMATSLIRIHAQRFDQIEAEFGSQMDAWTLFTLHSGRAQLFAYYMFGEMREEGVLALYNSCLALLNHVSLQPDEYMKFLPVVSIMILWQCASVVCRLWHSRWSENLDKATGERMYRKIIKKVMLASIFEHDVPFRASEIMAQMWTAFSAMRRSNHHRAVSATLTLRTRMSASVFFDSLWTMREGTEIRSSAPTALTRSMIARNRKVLTPASASAASASPAATAVAVIKNINNGNVDDHTSEVTSLEEGGAAISLHPLPQHQQVALAEPSWETNSAFLSSDSTLSHMSPVSPALSAMVDGTWGEMDAASASAIWRDVNAVMEDFGFGLGELPYVSP